jgi:hypothetical protein
MEITPSRADLLRNARSESRMTTVTPRVERRASGTDSASESERDQPGAPAQQGRAVPTGRRVWSGQTAALAGDETRGVA